MASAEIKLDAVELMRPYWATSPNHNQLVPGAQLPTRDGRRIGNAHIIDLSSWSPQPEVYVVLTDAGSRFHLTEGEIRELFHPSEWCSDPNEVIRKFDHQ